MSMFCYQCQETAKGTGCTLKGVCGKTEDVSNLQDLLLYTVKGVAIFSSALRKQGVVDQEINRFLLDGLFTTITNVNFDKQSVLAKIKYGIDIRDRMRHKLKGDNITVPLDSHDAAIWTAGTLQQFEEKAVTTGFLTLENEDIRSLHSLLVFGIKGIAAYAEHAANLGFENEDVYQFIEKGLLATLNNNLSSGELIDLVMECGKYGVDTMALLDKANTTRYGNPEISKVNIGVRNNPGILISGHDLRDLEDLLKQTEGTGVDVYTHSEMLPAHYYPAFKKFPHFAGNYGNSWWKQKEEFETFNGPILFTTNCLVPPSVKSTYTDNVYTTGSVAFPGFKHIDERKNSGSKDFSEIIQHALKCKPPTAIEQGEITGGFAHHQVFQLADKIMDTVKTGKIKKFVVMAGCDGRFKDREYYTEFARKLPSDTVILTAGCAKYRYIKLGLGDIDGIPRVLDAGQCNDSYSIAVIALKLKEMFGLKDINDLPVIYNIAWYEQKAVIVLLSLLYIGVKNIHLGPTLPAFLSPNVATVLVEKFGIKGIGSVETDLKVMLNYSN